MSDERDFKLEKPLKEILNVYLVIEKFGYEQGVEDVVAVYTSRHKAKAECKRLSGGDSNKHYVQTHKLIL